jgi:phage-related protein
LVPWSINYVIVKKASFIEKRQTICCAFKKQIVSLHKDLLIMESLIQFEVIFMDEVQEFLDSLAPESREKIVYNVRKVKDGYRDSELFKKMDGADNLWEFRTQYNGIQYRLLAFWDEQNRRLVVATHGFIKKTWKVPKKEISRAKALRKKYYELK